MKNTAAAISLALGLIITAWIAGKALNYKFRTRNIINVVGSSAHDFTADLVVWSGTYTRTSMELKDAYANLKTDEKLVREYLKNQGIADNEVIFSSVVIEKQFSYNYDQNGRQTGSTFTGYQLRQTVKIESKNIEKTEKISREITELLESGMELSSEEPQYYYTKLSDLKISLLAKAAADAYTRANTVATNAHGELGHLRKASMGVFQITGQHSNEDFSYGGAFNTASKDKTATITVRLEYELE